MSKKWWIIGLTLLLGQAGLTQNKYIPDDPYGITEGKQHFSRYLITSPRHFGPNALPVPRLSNASVIENVLIDLEFEQYKTDGGLTRNLFTQVGFPIAKGKASFIFTYVPYEFYQVDSALSRYRRTLSGKELDGYAHGDVYFGARAQLIKDKVWLPDLVFGMYARTASGTRIEDSRFTDSPGYYFDLSVGKSVFFGAMNQNYIRFHGSIGFYVWQTYLDEYPQNDALLYGFGIEAKLGQIRLLNTIRGYSGYMYNGDHPLVFRSELGVRQGPASVILGYEYGIRDYPFSGLKVGLRLNGFRDNENEG